MCSFDYGSRSGPGMLCCLDRYRDVMKAIWRWGVVVALAASAMSSARADTAAFDLLGPHVQMTVTRSGKTIPVSQVANLQAGDRLWIHPDFPNSQSVHYLMVVAFLRGTTNPPPEDWFIRADS